MPRMQFHYIGTLDGEENLLLIRQGVMRRIKAASVKGGKFETGGVLTGCYRGGHIDVIGNTFQQAKDRASQHSFMRQDAKHQSLVRRRWFRSNRILTYVGEWHSHPEAVPTPSAIDFNSWTQVCRRNKRTMIFVIVGYSSAWVGCAKYGAGEVEIIPSRDCK